ncbi:MAG: type II toxin-antitoxin system HicB family antitoxin [Gemmatimonadota bacterium]|nr:MAG: type II toxin-antitoxin system HicB family antitoxin [Gemmatimonadota bacterium]
MLTEYINKVMKRAVYEKLEDGTYWGEIPVCPGTNACKPTLIECQEELRSVLEDWILLSLQDGDELPVIDGIDLNRKPRDEREVVSV